MKKMFVVLVLAVLVLVGLYAYQQRNHNELPEGFSASNGRLELNRLDVASLYAGRIKAAPVDEGSYVKEGDILAELASESASSQLDAAKAQKQRAQEAVARADAEIQAYEQQRKVAGLELDNAQKLKRDGLVSDTEVAKRKAALDSATASLNAARAARAEARAAASAAQAQADGAASVSDDMVIRAPISGRVEYTIADAGSVIAAGSKVVSLLNPSDVSMNIFLPNAQMSPLKVGDEARIVLDNIDAVFPAKISFIATSAQFTPKAVETADERAKLMFKVRLKVPAEVALRYEGLLKGGMTGNGYVRTDAQAQWPANLAVRLPDVKN
ncbi:acriflavin resistance protein [Neisseria arctica]|uniref:Acriflavin resistance protein n=1 Tax=Neisseria arctica TaxID=1470200 RepID=A0A0J0YT63_9NEIS|nr:HlyD family efflux transporter periplasmic adaptor subunit [Neisseria arctica]KLT73314.1 acriflavin resistance protein [Neisseria arctica]UOO87422.1 HlyD family efflux transporter periplasmic adaptor subunit [Neisseria arctica]